MMLSKDLGFVQNPTISNLEPKKTPYNPNWSIIILCPGSTHGMTMFLLFQKLLANFYNHITSFEIPNHKVTMSITLDELSWTIAQCCESHFAPTTLLVIYVTQSTRPIGILFPFENYLYCTICATCLIKYVEFKCVNLYTALSYSIILVIEYDRV